MSDKPGDHPLPGPALSSCSPVIFTLKTGGVLYRHHRADQTALHYGKSGDYRFDDPQCSKNKSKAFGVMYAGEDVYCCFAESCLNITGNPIAVTTDYLNGRAIAAMEVARDLQFVDLVSSGGLASIGADGRLFTGSYLVAQEWSAALKKHHLRPNGIRYPSRHDPTRVAYALFGPRQGTLFKVSSLGALTAPQNSKLLSDLVSTYRISLLS